MGASASRVNVKVQFRRSKPYVKTLPFVAMGDGRTYASAARRLGPFVREVEDDVGAAFMGGILRLPSKFDLSGAWTEVERLSENEGEFRFKETVEVLVKGED